MIKHAFETKNNFPNFSTKTYAVGTQKTVGTQKNRLNETHLFKTQNIY